MGGWEGGRGVEKASVLTGTLLRGLRQMWCPVDTLAIVISTVWAAEALLGISSEPGNVIFFPFTTLQSDTADRGRARLK